MTRSACIYISVLDAIAAYRTAWLISRDTVPTGSYLLTDTLISLN